LTAESFYFNFERLLLLPLKDNEAKNEPSCRALLTKNILKESKIWVASGSIFYLPLSVTAGSQYFDILRTNNSTKTQQNFFQACLLTRG
jgi:hypothetical protein